MTDYYKKPCFDADIVDECLEGKENATECQHLCHDHCWADCDSGGKSEVLASYRDEENTSNRQGLLFPLVKEALNGDEQISRHQRDLIIEFIELHGWKMREPSDG